MVLSLSDSIFIGIDASLIIYIYIYNVEILQFASLMQENNVHFLNFGCFPT